MGTIEDRIRSHPFSERSRNENEHRVAEKLLEIHGEYTDTCFCQQCLDQMFCIALNALPAKYENALVHRIDKKNSCTDEEIEKAARTAIRKVSEHPKGATEHHPGK